MTGKERTLRALYFQEPDRAPIMGGYFSHGPFIEEASGIRPWWKDPQECLRRTYRNLGVDAIGANVLPKTPEQSAALGDGSVSNFTRKGENPYKSPEDVLQFVRNQPPLKEQKRGFDEQRVYDEIKNHYLNGQAEAGDDRLWIPWGGFGAVGFMWYSTFGYENYYMALALYEKEMEILFANAGELGRMRNEILVKCYEENNFPKVVWGGEDICDNRGPMLSPSLLRRIYFPHLKKAFQPLFDANIKLVWHSDGNIKPILEDLLDAGVGGFQGMQEHMPDPELNNSLEELSQLTDHHGDPLIFFGSISCRRTLPFGTPDDVRTAAQRCMDISKARGGGIVIFPDNTVGPDVPTENLFALYEYVTGVKAKRYFVPNVTLTMLN